MMGRQVHALVLGALPQGTLSLLDLGRMRPDNSPMAVSLFVKIRVPKRDGPARTPLDRDPQVRLIPDDSRAAVELNPNFSRLPLEVVQFPGRDVFQVLFLRQRPAYRVNQLEVIRMQATSGSHICIYKRA